MFEKSIPDLSIDFVLKLFGTLDGNIDNIESAFSVRWVAEVVDFMAGIAERLDDFRIVLVSPTAGYIYLCHRLVCKCGFVICIKAWVAL